MTEDQTKMKTFFLLQLIFLYSGLSLAEPFPISLPTPNDLIRINFQKFREYIYTFERRSKISYYSNGCRLYEYRKSRRDKIRPFTFCIYRKRSKDSLIETLVIENDKKKKVRFIISRIGKDIDYFPNDMYFKFNFPTPSIYVKYQINLPEFKVISCPFSGF